MYRFVQRVLFCAATELVALAVVDVVREKTKKKKDVIEIVIE